MTATGGAVRSRRLAALALIVVTLNMRAAILCIPPVLGAIRRDLHLSATLQGLLVSLPVICFGVFAFAGPRIARRLGIEATLALSMLVLCAGILLRLDLWAAALFAGTVLIGTAIGISNVVVPALIKRDFPDHVGRATGLYITTMLAVGALAAGGTVPLMHATGIGWRWAAVIWAAPSLLAAAVWMALSRRPRAAAEPDLAVEPVTGLWRDRVAWQVTLFMGMQSLTFYSVAAWMPTLLHDNGIRLTTGGLLLAIMTGMGLPASVGASVLAGGRHQRRQLLAVLFVVGVSAIGLLGLVIAPAGGALAWTLLFGVGQGGSLGLALTFIGMRSPDSHHATQLSGMAQSFGYLLAAVGPLFLGDIHAAAGSWTLPMALIAAITVPQLLTGLAAARPRLVGGTSAARYSAAA